MLNPPNVATPLETATAPPPVSDPPPRFEALARLTLVLLAVVTVLPPASFTATLNDARLVAEVWLAGWTVKVRWCAVPSVMLNALDVAPVTAAVALIV